LFFIIILRHLLFVVGVTYFQVTILMTDIQCEEGEVFKKYKDLRALNQAALDREIDTFRLFHGRECLLTTATIVVDPKTQQPVGFITKEMDCSLPNFLLISSLDRPKQPQRPSTIEVTLGCLFLFQFILFRSFSLPCIESLKGLQPYTRKLLPIVTYLLATFCFPEITETIQRQVAPHH